MEKNFCGKCGKPLADCECPDRGRSSRGVVISGGGGSKVMRGSEGAKRTVKRFDTIALGDGEVPIRRYQIGRIQFLGSGSSHVLVTNRRVIAHSESHYLFTVTNSAQEVEIASITGVTTYLGKGFKKKLLTTGLALLVLSLILLIISSSYGRYLGMGGGVTGFGVFLLITSIALIIFSRRPCFIFSVNANNSGNALRTEVNTAGVLTSSHGGSGGLIFNFAPTEEVVKMIRELGACILDVKAKGDYAIDTWKNIDDSRGTAYERSPTGRWEDSFDSF